VRAIPPRFEEGRHLAKGLDAYYGFGLLQVIVPILWSTISQEEHTNVQQDSVAQILWSIES